MSHTTSASLNFASDDNAPGAYEHPFSKHFPSGVPLHLRPVEVPIHDLRRDVVPPCFETTGLTWMKSPYDIPAREEVTPEWQTRYVQDVSIWLKDHIGARACVPMSWNVRQRTLPSDKKECIHNTMTPEEQQLDLLAIQPSSGVHVDYSADRMRDLILDALGSDYSSASRLAMINVWRPLKGPVIDAPLALCDARTLHPEDLVRTTDMFGGGYFIKHNENMRWVYLRDQMPDEAFLFRQFDSSVEHKAGAASCVAHCGFIDATRPTPKDLRSSIEARFAVAY